MAFPGNRFNGAILPALADLVSAGTIRPLDLLFVYKDADGTVGAVELNDIAAQFGPVPMAEDAVGGLLDAEDVDEVGAGLQPNSSVALLCWGNSWAAPFVAALEASGAQLLDQATIPREAVLSALSGASQS